MGDFNLSLLKMPLIEGLRAMAVVAVMVNHFWPQFLPSGYLGVDVFFVISGYVITKVLLDNSGVRQTEFFERFLARRVARIFPALLVCVAVTMVLVALFVQPLSIDYWKNAITGISSIIGLSNIFLVVDQSDYFGRPADFNFFIHTWSLCVEIQFYLLFPFIFLSRSRTKSSRRFSLRFLIVAGISLVSLVMFVLANSVNSTTTYYLMPTRFWEFGAGSIACMLAPKITNAVKKSNSMIVPVALGLLFAVMFVSFKYNAIATVVAVGATFWCIAVPAPGIGIANLVTNRTALWIGERSYSIYLWHWVLLTAARWTVGVTVISSLVLVLLTLCCAVMSFKWVEKPFRQWAKVANPRSVIKRGLEFVIAVVLFMYLIAFPLRGALFLGTDAAEFQTTKSIFSTGCDVRKITFSGLNTLDRCASGVDGTTATIFLIGDSHAKQFENPLRDMAMRRGMRFVSVWGSACIFPPVATSDASCKAGGQLMQALVTAEVKAGDIIIVANYLLDYLSNDEQTNGGANKNSEVVDSDALEIYAQDLKLFAQGVQAHGGRVVSYLDGLLFPELDVGALCSREWFRPTIPSKCYRDKSTYLKSRLPLEKAMNILEVKGVIQVWDGMQWSDCDGDTCVASRMSDSNHYIDWYSWVVVKDSENWLLG